MKKTIFGAMGCLLSVLFFSCHNNHPTEKTKQPATASDSLTTCNNCKTLNGFDGQQAVSMIANFADGDNYKNDIGKKSVYAWYSINQIAEINDLITQEASKIDGVRLYLGSENDPKTNGGSSKLIVHLFWVSTRLRTIADGPGGGSPYVDYYEHSEPYLQGSASPFGDAIHDNAQQGLSDGALLYDSNNPPIRDVCNNPSSHYINDITAYCWAEQRQDANPHTDQSGYNTKSEWFSSCFIQGLFNALTYVPNGFSGLRVYLGKGYIDPASPSDGPRDVFILVPTKTALDSSGNPIKDSQGNTVQNDSYQCVEDLPNFPDCDETTLSGHRKIMKSKISLQSLKNDIKKNGYWFGGYDDGELCPNSCN